MTGKGSSPRMRGTRSQFTTIDNDGGIIPAHAGNTCIFSTGCTRCWDHPRACGEHELSIPRKFTNSGSSPRMRGTHVIYDGEQILVGIIPAHAGNTAALTARTQVLKDHPRACGEHPSWGPPEPVWTGSSPRMRGTLFRNGDDAIRYGIIPAHAGNTALRKHLRTGRGDHPRACGEHYRVAIAPVELRGSSPRMRGTLLPCPRPTSLRGIIPAHAGNTSPSSTRSPTAGDHPRACGEHAALNVEALAAAGSSPRMRGTLLSEGHDE